MTEIHCPACSALLNLSVNVAGSTDGQFTSEPIPRSQSVSDIREKDRLAQFNASLAAALREFLAVHPWEGHRLPGDIHADFIAWLRGAPEDREFYRFLRPVPVTKNRVSKLLVSEIGATFIKGPKGREYRLPESLQPAGGGDTRAGLSVVPEPEVPLTVGGGLVPAARAELAGEGSLELAGVASLPLAAHVAAVKAQAAAEDAGVDYMFVTKDGVRHKVPLKSRGDVASLVQEENMQEPADYSLPANLVLDGPSVFPVEAGPEPASYSGSWFVYLTDDEAELSYEELEQIAMARLPERFLLAGAPILRYDKDGMPYAWCLVHTVDGQPAGDGFIPVPSSDVAFVEMYPSREAVAEAAAAPLPSSAELAAVAGHEALERARTAAAPAAPVFLAAEDLDAYEGADPGDWG